MNLSKSALSDLELASLIQKWQNSPKEYLNLLIQEVYQNLYAICKKQIDDKKILQNDISATASSLVNEVFIKIGQGRVESIDSVQTFYRYSRVITRNILVDRYRKKHAQKRMLVNDVAPKMSFERFDGDSAQSIESNIEDFIKVMEKLKKIEPKAHEAISIKFYNAKSDEQIANIMGSSKSSVERHIKHGRHLLNALIRGVDIPVL